MKRTERHHLKENELAESLARLRSLGERYDREIKVGAVLLVIALVGVGGWVAYRERVDSQARELLAQALATASAPVVPPVPATGDNPAGAAPPLGSFPSERARLDAALTKFIAAADAYPSARASVTARYHAATMLVELGRLADAEKQYQAVADQAPNDVYGRMARLGLAEVRARAGRYDEAIAAYTEIAGNASGDLPVDGVLMQLGRAYARAGRTADAVKTFTRIVEEFPQSPFVAEARQELDALKLPAT